MAYLSFVVLLLLLLSVCFSNLPLPLPHPHSPPKKKIEKKTLAGANITESSFFKQIHVAKAEVTLKAGMMSELEVVSLQRGHECSSGF